LRIFLCAGGVVFLLGFLRKVRGRCGVFVVKLWWNVWQSWRVDGRYSGRKIAHGFSDLFCEELGVCRCERWWLKLRGLETEGLADEGKGATRAMGRDGQQ
jgi:hypothetical protein